MRRRRTINIVLIFLLLTVIAAAARKKRPAEAPQFSYYVLALSYAPDFCNQPKVNKDPLECGAGRHIGFVVHGLWPQGDVTRGPQNCGPARPVSQTIIQVTLPYIPTESLIQHEWATHGTCSGLSAADYFAALRKARESISIPDDLKQPSQQQQLGVSGIEAKMAQANPAFPPKAFRVSCYNDRELQEIRVCFNKDLTPRECSRSVGECPASTVMVLPVP
jgi:ribonuclease T2